VADDRRQPGAIGAGRRRVTVIGALLFDIALLRAALVPSRDLLDAAGFDIRIVAAGVVVHPAADRRRDLAAERLRAAPKWPEYAGSNG